MSEEMKNSAETPSLTLEPELVMTKESDMIPAQPLMEESSEMNEVQKEMAGTVLTAEEQEMVDSFASMWRIPPRSCSMEPELRKKWRIFRMKLSKM